MTLGMPFTTCFRSLRSPNDYLPSARADEPALFRSVITDINFYIVKFFLKRFGTAPLIFVPFLLRRGHACLSQTPHAQESLFVTRCGKVFETIGELLTQFS